VVSVENRVKVLRLFSRLNIGGPSVHVILLTAGLDPLGYETRLVVGDEAEREGNLFELAESKGVRWLRMPGLEREIRPIGDLRCLWALVRLMREERPTIVHTHTAKAGVVGRIAARLSRVPIVVHTYHGHVLRGYFGRAKSAVFRCIEAALARVTHAVLTVSDAVSRDLVEMGVVPADRLRVVPLGLELQPLAGGLQRGGLRREAGFADDAPLVGIVGRLVPIKDVGCFLEAAALVLRSRPQARFSIVGDGAERARLEKQALRLGLGNRVHFHGWKRDLPGLYGDLDLVVNCSRNEGTPVALIESLAAARPVVATRVGGTPDVLRDGRFGALVAPGDPAALAGAILEHLETPERGREMARAGQSEVLTRYSVQRLVTDMDELYRSLLAQRAPGAPRWTA